MNKEQAKRLLWTVFASGIPADSELDILRRHVLLNLIGILGAVFLGLFAFISFMQGDYVLGCVDFAILLFVASLLYFLRTKEKDELIGFLGTIVTGVFFLFLVAYSSAGRSTYFWALLYPLISLNLLGKRTGTYVSFTLLGLSLFFFLGITGSEILKQFDSSFIIRFTAVYLTIHLMSLVAEIVREKIQDNLKTSKSELQKTLSRVQKSSEELVDSNRQLLMEIEGRKRIEKALKNSEGFLDDVIESIQDGISVLNPDLTIRHTNSVMKEWYKQNLPLLGKKCHICYHNQQTPCDPCPTLRCLQSGQTEREVVPGLPGSPVEWVELFCFPIKDKETGRITGAVEFVRDITMAKRLEGHLYHAQKMQAVGTLAGGIAHDFNNLLMGILGRTSLMAVEFSPSDPNLEHVKAIEEYIQSATNLTGQLLGAARGGKYDPKPTNLNDLVERSSSMFGRARKEITIQMVLSRSPLVVEIDREQVEQVLLNMYVNAWQAMPTGGDLRLQTSIEELTPLVCEPHQVSPGIYGKISISDSGLGMDESTLQQVFDPFFTTKDKSRGTGLGLASAYGIIKNHHGFITVQSELARGTTFIIYLPVSGKEPAEKISVESGIVKGIETVLLVDDQNIIIEVGQALLSELGYRVLTAEGGEKALEALQRTGGNIDLVILDLIMPGMDGGATFEAIRGLYPSIPVILSSGYAIDGLATEILRKGCNGFIQKPFNLSELSQKIRSVFDGGETAQRVD
jgi:two-component system cell cycle sensor histidine kinase/response regulator CckA